MSSDELTTVCRLPNLSRMSRDDKHPLLFLPISVIVTLCERVGTALGTFGVAVAFRLLFSIGDNCVPSGPCDN